MWADTDLSGKSEWKLTAQSGRSENVASEPGTLSVGSTNDTVAAARGLEVVAPAPNNVVAPTSAFTKAEHCTLTTLAISTLVRVWFGRCLGWCMTDRSDHLHYKIDFHKSSTHRQGKKGWRKCSSSRMAGSHSVKEPHLSKVAKTPVSIRVCYHWWASTYRTLRKVIHALGWAGWR